ncbi:hypothetical protein HG536_0E02250 [Torulaspora globosa]|uniref:PCI domain-containing protein n=1 Tax=Torulaspora globosa TaxID=48254 RepID=A0A7G3ZIH8_9SACH|nr:uncharacterized protein HG536_0E02250 [Torulaspora globosa]QLL33314.1 hypothetical protein HG536_0E02250 [Torulaspora globosa]
MSDEEDGNANYDDFMMSDEEVDIVEMEEETDEEDGCFTGESEFNVEASTNEILGALDERELERLCDEALSFMEDQDFKRSRDLLQEVQHNTDKHKTELTAIVWRWRLLSQIARSWLFEIHYNGIDDRTFRGTLDAFRALVDHLDRTELLNGDLVRRTLTDLLHELCPSSKRDFLFAVELIADDSMAWKMQLRLQCIALLQASPRLGEATLTDEVRDTIELKRITAKVWSDRLDKGHIDLRDIQKIQESCCETSIEEATNDQHYADKIGLVLQCHIFNYLSGHGDLPRDLFSRLIEQLELFSSNSLSVSQHLGLMIQLSTVRALVMLSGLGRDESRIELPLFYRDIRALREQFWSCLQQMEEIGGSRQNFSSLFEQFILSGFIFCSMILHRRMHDQINPFDLEQLKVALEAPSIRLLRTIYHNFLQLDLRKLHEAIQQLSGVRELLKRLIDNIYYLGQLAKLWEQIAPVYSCISLKDIQNMLEIDATLRVSRDELLTVLMTSILNNTAKIYYKLDLTRDLVYFGDEYRVQLCSHPKKSFVNKTVVTESGVKLSHLEIANNIGVFDQPCSLKGLDSCAFFDKIQRSRDHIQAAERQDHSKLHVSGARCSEKYEELASLATELLTFSDIK